MMATGRLFDHTGDVVSTFHYDHSTDTPGIMRTQKARPYLDQNARCRADSVQTGDLRLKGSIPFVLLEYLLKQRGLTYYQWRRLGRKERDRWFAEVLNDRDNYKLRTAEPMRKNTFSGNHAPKLLLPGA